MTTRNYTKLILTKNSDVRLSDVTYKFIVRALIIETALLFILAIFIIYLTA